MRDLLPLLLFCAFGLHFTQIQGQGFTSRKTQEGIEISEGGSKVLFYQIKPKSSDGKYERTNYIHPLYSLKGKVLTEDFPEDHPHHRGVFWAWHQIIHNNKQIADGWSCENISWKVVSSDVEKKKDRIVLDNEVVWRSPLGGDQEVPVIRENSRITVHAATDKYRIIDFEISLLPLTDSLKIGGSDDPKGYGGFSVRFKLPQDIIFLSGNRKLTAQELAIQAGPWLDFYGSFEGKDDPASGITLFCHPSNPGYPEPWILRNAKSMQNPAFPGRHAVDLTNEGWRLQYRLMIHSGALHTGDLERMYREYAQLKFQ